MLVKNGVHLPQFFGVQKKSNNYFNNHHLNTRFFHVVMIPKNLPIKIHGFFQWFQMGGWFHLPDPPGWAGSRWTSLDPTSSPWPRPRYLEVGGLRNTRGFTNPRPRPVGKGPEAKAGDGKGARFSVTLIS